MAVDAGSRSITPRSSWMLNKSPGTRISIPPKKRLHNYPLACWKLNPQGIIQHAEGDGLEKISPDPGELLGESFSAVFKPYPVITDACCRALSGTAAEVDIELEGRLWECHFFPAHTVKGETAGALSIWFEISSQQAQVWHQEALMTTAASLRKARSHQEMPGLIFDQLESYLQIDRAALVIRPSQEHTFQLSNLWGKWSSPKRNGEIRSRLEGVLTSSLINPTLHDATSMTEDELLENGSCAHIAGAAVSSQNELLGALWAGRKQAFQRKELALLHSVAEMTASAFTRAREHELTQQRLERLAALHSIDQAISGNFNLNLTLSVILSQVVSQLEVDAADIFLYDPDTQQLTYAEGRGFRRYQPQQGTTQAWEGLVWRVVQKRDLVSLPNLRDEAPTLVRGGMFAAEGFQAYFAVPLIAKGKIQGVLEVFHRKPARVDKEWFDFLRTLATQAAIAMDNASLVENLRRTNLKLDQAYQATLEGWVRALDLRDKCTEGHTQRVVERTLKLAQAVGIAAKDLIHIQRGALLHDIGKLGIPDEILNKPGPLTEQEWALMQLHPVYAREMLKPIDFLHPALHIPYAHHEKWDGTGYPAGTRGTEIPLAARVFTVIDVWDALSSDRPYREAWEDEKVYRYIREQAGSHFDPQIVQTWERLFQIPG